MIVRLVKKIRTVNQAYDYIGKNEEIKVFDNAVAKVGGEGIATAYKNSVVRVGDSAVCYAKDKSVIYAYDNATVYAYNNATVYACGDVTVIGYDNAIINIDTPDVSVDLLDNAICNKHIYPNGKRERSWYKWKVE